MNEPDDLTKKGGAAEPLPGCSCGGDPFASLPPDRQPKNKSWKSAFKKVTCKRCEKDFWTNSKYAYCHECRKEGR